MVENIKSAHADAEKWLYRYNALKWKDLKTRAEIVHDAIWPSTASTEGMGVKSSNISDPTGRGGIMLATAEYQTLTQEELIWMLAIDAAKADLDGYAPEIGRVMSIVYGLDPNDWRPRTKGNRAKYRIKAMMECGIDRDNTYYEWRQKILETVICCRMRLLEQ